MKRTLSLLLTVIMLMGVLFAALPVSAAATGTIELSSGSLNIRKSPSTSAAKVGTLRDGDEVTVKAKNTQSSGVWYRIVTENGAEGYVLSDYVKLGGSSSSSGGSSSTTSSKTGRVRTKTMKIYSSKSSKSTLLATAEYQDTVTVVEMTSSSAWAKVTYNGKTGYCNKTSFELVDDGSSSTGGSTSTDGAAFITYKKPSYTTYTSKSQVIELVNYNLANFNKNFSFQVNTTSGSTVSNLLPNAKRDVLYGYLYTGAQLDAAGLTNSIVYHMSGNTVYATVYYNEAGEVLAYYKNNTPITTSAAKSLLNKVQDILDEVVDDGMSDYEKALALHDYICENVVYSDTSLTAYEALVNGRANCQGYAEATGLLYTLAGLENHIVRATNKHTDKDHGYVKVKIDGTWYVVDTTADDPVDNSNPTPRHDFFLVSDEILETRYTPWLDIYPDCNSMTLNYYQVNDLVVSSSSELSNLIREAVKDKKSSLEVWVDNYSTSRYPTSTLKKVATDNGAETVNMYRNSEMDEQCAIYFKFSY